jgi:formylglycine-generating enzyme required for sulfatase activity
MASLELLEQEVAAIKAGQSGTDLNELQLKIQALRNQVSELTVEGDVGAGSVLGSGSVDAEVIAGRDVIDKSTSINAPNATIVVGQDTEPVKIEGADAEEAYLRWLFRTTRRVSLGSIDLVEADATQQAAEITLDAVYVALDVRTSDKLVRGAGGEPPGETPSLLPALEAVRYNRTLVLLGDPGSGKSTFVNYLALCLAGARLEPEVGWLGRLRSVGYVNGKAEWPHGALLPVHVVLRDFAASLPADIQEASADLLWKHIKSGLAKHGLEDYAPQLLEALRKGQCMVLLDGLDEVPDAARRKWVRDAVDDFAVVYSRNRFVVTCRVLSYTNPDWQLPTFPTAWLSPLDDDQIATFIGAWYDTLARQKRLPSDMADAKAAELREAATYLRDLAQNPMLLTVMAVIHTFQGTLPYERARLYDEAVELLLWRWQLTKRVPGAGWDPGIEQQLGTRVERLFNALCELAWKAHADQGKHEGAADLPQKDVLSVLQSYLGNDWGKAQKFCRYVEERSGLLVGRGTRKKAQATDGKSEEAIYAFPHRTFQEFLAGCYLAGQREFSRKVRGLVAEGEPWREVVMLAAGHLVFNQNLIAAPLDAVNVLCPDKPPTDKTGWRAVWWAGEILSIVGVDAAGQDDVGKEVLPRVRRHLVALLEGGHLSPAQRVQAADALGRLDDPREGVCTPEPAMVEIAGGRFRMGEGTQQHEVALAPFQLARYPVTNAQFWQFIDGGGYEERRFWTEDGWAWRQRAGDDLAGFANDLRWGIANRPVVGVNWFEAMAYAAWLSEQTGKRYRLPTEAEWERAAAGPDARLYPWGEDWRDGMTNTQEAGIGHTSAVGAFPQDATPEGIYDLGGNVWEWTQSCSAPYPYQEADGRNVAECPGERVLRGGACSNSKRLARCAYRNWSTPEARVPFIGFRVALANTPPALPAPSESSQ